MALEIKNLRKEFRKEYPKNLLLCINKDWSRKIAENITDEVKKGLEYALSLLDEREQEIVRLRYREHISLREVGELYNIKRERTRQVEAKSLIKLGKEEYATFIINGISGTVKAAYDKGYSTGYNEGYEKGLAEARNELERPFMKEHILALPLEALAVSQTTVKHLKNAGCVTISDVADITYKEICKIKPINVAKRKEIAGGFKRFGLKPPKWNLI